MKDNEFISKSKTSRPFKGWAASPEDPPVGGSRALALEPCRASGVGSFGGSVPRIARGAPRDRLRGARRPYYPLRGRPSASPHGNFFRP
jgi:hypothetical protein